MYIERILEKVLREELCGEEAKGVILAGIVGAGKTTLVEHLLDALKGEYQTFSFTGDDIRFRDEVARDTTYLHDYITSRTQQRAVVFVDEVQKTEAVFDAVKYCFDRGISFIISGSNPKYLATVARKRLQRRGRFYTLSPLTLPEILGSKNLAELSTLDRFRDFLSDPSTPPSNLSLSYTEQIEAVIETYLQWGGIPLVYKAKNEEAKLEEVQKIVERGFEAVTLDTEDVTDVVRIELAMLQSREFAYQGVMKRTGMRRRDTINEIIEDLMGHGYLVKKKPKIFEDDRRSYLSVYSYIDTGIVTYLSGETTDPGILGLRIEGYIHSRLISLQMLSAQKTSLHYYKPYKIGSDNKVKFQDGEIDFLYNNGKQLIPIEVKSEMQRGDIDISHMEQLMKDQNLSTGVVLYGGVPYFEEEKQLLFWPYWFI